MIIEKIYRCRIDWDCDEAAAMKAWNKACDKANLNDEEIPDYTYPYMVAQKKIDAILREYDDRVDYTNTGAGPAWGAYLIIMGGDEFTVGACALSVIEAIKSTPFATVMEDA